MGNERTLGILQHNKNNRNWKAERASEKESKNTRDDLKSCNSDADWEFKLEIIYHSVLNSMCPLLFRTKNFFVFFFSSHQLNLNPWAHWYAYTSKKITSRERKIYRMNDWRQMKFENEAVVHWGKHMKIISF